MSPKTRSSSPNGTVFHTVTGDSGRQYRMRLLGIPTLLGFGDLPEDLVDLALADVTETLNVDVPEANGVRMVIPGSIRFVAKAEERQERLERVVSLAAYQRQLVAACLVEPAYSYEELTDAVRAGAFPEEDLLMLAEIVQRIRDRDARGVKIGVEPLDRWVPFPHEHEGVACPGDEGCPGRKAFQQSLSSLDLGAL